MEIWVYNQYNDQRDMLEMPDGSTVTIGRDESNDITLESPFVSRHHAQIKPEGKGYAIESLGLNGLTVANRDVAPREQVRLGYGDEIRLGEFSLYMMEPSQRRVVTGTIQSTPRKRVMDVEQTIHADLLDRLNLRVTGQKGATDEQHVGLIKRHLRELIGIHAHLIDTEM